MKEEESMTQVVGENVGFIKKFTNKISVKQQNLMQKSSDLGQEVQANKKLSAETISKLDLNEIGNSEDSVVELQAQLKTEEVMAS
jgi:hypothetical protein